MMMTDAIVVAQLVLDKEPPAHVISEQRKAIHSVIVRESDRHGLDPLILVSIIETESGFKVRKKGRHGEVGLMQIKPSTARWIAEQEKLPWAGPQALTDPETNIRLGAAYLARLKREFRSDKKLYLAAYNMGPSNLRRALRRRVIPKAYASRVLRNYLTVKKI